MNEFQYHLPTSLDEALRLANEIEGAAFIAGGTDLMVQLRDGRRSPAALISLRRLPGMAGIDEGPPARIGGLTLVADMVESSFLAERYPAINDAARPFGCVQIRNAATLAGNLCTASPAADLAPPLLVHGADVTLRSAAGERTIALDALFLGPGETAVREGEILTGVTLPEPSADSGSAFLRKTRVAMDISIASAAAYVRVQKGRLVEVRVAAGAVAPTPRRLPKVEAALLGRALDEDALAEARRIAPEEISPITDLRASADYRAHLLGVVMARALTRAFQRSQR